jgi:hypothetical protein
MLNFFRKATENIILRLLIFLVAIAFVAWGFNGVFSNHGGQNIVEFKYCEPITRNELINNIKEQQKLFAQAGQSLEESHIRQIVLREMIHKRLMSFFIKDLSITVGDQDIVKSIKNIPDLQNDQKQLDKNKLDSFLRHINLTEEQYFDYVSQTLSTSLLNEIFEGSNYQSKMIIDKLGSFLSEERTASIISIDKNKLISNQKFSVNPQELQTFFKENAEKFRVPEKRDIQYIVLDAAFFLNRKLLEDAKDSSKLQKLVIEYEKLLEDEVASGFSFAEIAKKFNIEAKSIKNILLTDLNLPNIGDILPQIFDLQQDEVSYPFEINGQKIILVKIENINRSFIPELKDVNDKAKAEFVKILAHREAKKTLDDIYAKAQSTNLTCKDFYNFAKQANIKLSKNLKVAKESSNNNIPVDLVNLIFQTKTKMVTPPYFDDNHGYIAFIEDIHVDQNLKRQVGDKRILATIKSGYMSEVISHLYKLNQIKINYNDPVFKQ